MSDAFAINLHGLPASLFIWASEAQHPDALMKKGKAEVFFTDMYCEFDDCTNHKLQRSRGTVVYIGCGPDSRLATLEIGRLDRRLVYM